jgi:hypothetical protein
MVFGRANMPRMHTYAHKYSQFSSVHVYWNALQLYTDTAHPHARMCLSFTHITHDFTLPPCVRGRDKCSCEYVLRKLTCDALLSSTSGYRTDTQQPL